MFQSPHYAHVILRIGLAIVFLWFGIGAFVQPLYWIHAWLPGFLQNGVPLVGMSAFNVMELTGILEVLIAASVATGFFVRWFAIAGAILFIVVMATHSLTEVFVRDVGLTAALLSLALWPERRYS